MPGLLIHRNCELINVGVFFKFFYLFILNFMYGSAGSLLLHGPSLVVEIGAYFLVVVCGLPIVLASLVVEHRL